jgi:hypothetical protein
MATDIQQGFKVGFTIGSFIDADGNAATIDKVVSVTVSDPTVAELVDQSADLLSGAVKRIGTSPLIQTLTVVVDGDHAGDTTFTILGEFACSPNNAVAGGITFGTPVLA